jgi:hypothetical protein
MGKGAFKNLNLNSSENLFNFYGLQTKRRITKRLKQNFDEQNLDKTKRRHFKTSMTTKRRQLKKPEIALPKGIRNFLFEYKCIRYAFFTL